MEYVKCEYCDYTTIRSCLERHLIKVHNKTLRENTLKRLNLTEEDLPKCKFCNNPVEVLHELQEVCENENCKKELRKLRKHLGAVKAAQTQIKNGTYHFLKENLVRDESGKSIMHSKSASKANQTKVSQGTHPFSSQNLVKDDEGKSVLHKTSAQKRIDDGSHPWLAKNLERDEQGKSIRHKNNGKKIADTTRRNHTSNLKHENLILDESGKSIVHKKIAATRTALGNLHGHKDHVSDYNPEFIEKNFVKDGKFDLKACCSYFNMTVSPINKFKHENNITAPNETDVHKQQIEIYDFIRSFYQGTVHVDDRNIITPKELDIVIPEKHLAIEFNGLNFHGQGTNALGFGVNTDKEYHLQKTIAAEDAGYQLLHIFEDEWISPVKREIWKSVIRNKLGYSKRIYARKTTIAEVPSATSKSFQEENHLQGAVNSTINYGLFFEGELVSLMTFGKSRFDKSYEYELLRFCNKRDCTVVGGSSKLLKYFIKNHGSSLVSYANRRWSNGHLYESLGFTKDQTTPPDYFYFKPEDKELKHRMVFQKGKLKDIPGFVFDEKSTEVENMLNNGYMRIFDCGNFKYVY